MPASQMLPALVSGAAAYLIATFVAFTCIRSGTLTDGLYLSVRCAILVAIPALLLHLVVWQGIDEYLMFRRRRAAGAGRCEWCNHPSRTESGACAECGRFLSDTRYSRAARHHRAFVIGGLFGAVIAMLLGELACRYEERSAREHAAAYFRSNPGAPHFARDRVWSGYYFMVDPDGDMWVND